MVIAEEKIKKLRVLGIKMDQNKTPNGLQSKVKGGVSYAARIYLPYGRKIRRGKSTKFQLDDEYFSLKKKFPWRTIFPDN